jgi:hypothetical protein
MTDRHTADTINDNDLDQLYAENAELRDALAHCHEREPRQRAEATLARIRGYAQHAIDAGDTGPGPAIGRLLLQLLDEQTASTAPLAACLPLVKGRCPACGWASLFLGNGGHTTCARLDCPNPCAADDLLHGSDNLAAWQPQTDGTWTLDIDEGGGVITMPRQTTMRERAQFAAAWTAVSGRPAPPSAATEAAESVPCPACARAGQAGLDPTEQHPDCRTQEQH